MTRQKQKNDDNIFAVRRLSVNCCKTDVLLCL